MIRTRQRSRGSAGSGGGGPPNLGLVTGAWSGDITDDSFRGSAYYSGTYTESRIAASLNSDLSDPVYGDLVPIVSNLAKMEITGLDPDTQYYWGVEVDGQLDGGRWGKFKTLPVADSFAYKFATFCCTNGAPISTVYAAIEAENPLVGFHLGDLHYLDLATASLAPHIAGLTARMSDSVFGPFLTRTPTLYMYDDHDSAGNDASSANVGMPPSVEAYRSVVPHPPTVESGATDAPYFVKVIGDICHIVLDTRSRRVKGSGPTDPTATMLGTVQKQWLKDTLVDPAYDDKAYVIHSSVHWTGVQPGNGDAWPYFYVERAELADYMKAQGLQGRVAMTVGDAHMLAADNGMYSDYATGGGMNIPQFAVGSLDSEPGTKGGPYYTDMFAGRNQYALFDVTPGSGVVSLSYTGKNSVLGDRCALTTDVRTSPSTPTAVTPLWRLGFYSGLVASDTANGTVLADFVTPEWYTAGAVVYTKQADPDNKFTVTDDTLVLADVLVASVSYSVTIRATYPSGLFVDQVLSITGALPATSSGTALSLTFLAGAVSSGDLSTYTFAAQPFGTADAARYIVASISFRAAQAVGSIPVTSVTIGGITATLVNQYYAPDFNAGSPSVNFVGQYIALVPTGTSGSVVVNLGASALRAGCVLHRLVGIPSTTPDYTVTASRGAGETNVAASIPKVSGGVAIGIINYPASSRTRLSVASEVTTDGGLTDINGTVNVTVIDWTGISTADYAAQMETSGNGSGQHMLVSVWSPAGTGP
jgi:hypothetical protein